MKHDTAELRLECARLTGGDLDAARKLLAWVLEGYEGETAWTLCDPAHEKTWTVNWADRRCRPTGPAREVEWP